MAEIATGEPAIIPSGTTVKWVRYVDDYPAEAGWALTYEIVGGSGAGVRKTVTSAPHDGVGYLVMISATDNDFSVGVYQWAAYIAKDDERYRVDMGQLTVEDDLSSAVTDGRTDAQRGYDAVRAMLQGRASQEQKAMEFDGRKLERVPISELLLLEEYLRRQVMQERRAERARKGLPPRRRNIRIKFTG